MTTGERPDRVSVPPAARSMRTMDVVLQAEEAARARVFFRSIAVVMVVLEAFLPVLPVCCLLGPARRP